MRTMKRVFLSPSYSQAVFSELLKRAIAEAEAMFDHPYKQYMLFKDLEQKVSDRKVEFAGA